MRVAKTITVSRGSIVVGEPYYSVRRLVAVVAVAMTDGDVVVPIELGLLELRDLVHALEKAKSALRRPGAQ